MVDKKLVEYIQKAYKKGSSISKAEKDLIMAGHDMDDVDAAGKIVRKKHFEKLGIMILSLVLVLALIAFIVEFFRPEPAPPLSQMDLLEQAIIDGDISACDQFGPAKRDLCIRTIDGSIKEDIKRNAETRDYIAKAVAENDSSACYSLSSSVMREKCLIDTGAKKAPVVESEVVDDSGEVVKTQAQIDQELFDLALESNDINICNQISSLSKRTYCFSMVEG
jgi:hypothetical protein